LSVGYRRSRATIVATASGLILARVPSPRVADLKRATAIKGESRRQTQTAGKKPSAPSGAIRSIAFFESFATYKLPAPSKAKPHGAANPEAKILSLPDGVIQLVVLSAPLET
jgi:hypothetical protein